MRHSFLGLCVPLCLALGTLSACGGDSDSGVGTRTTEDDDDSGGADDDASDDDATDDDSSAADDDTSNDDTSNDDTSAADDDDSAGADDEAADDDVAAGDPGIDPLDFPEVDAEDLEPREPLLPDTPPETPVSDLGEDEFEELCEPYLDQATTTVSSLDGLCGLAGINAANDSMAATDEEYQRACGEARIQCETDSAAAQVLLESLECTMPEDCTATVAQVEACYQQMHLLNAAILEPLGLTEFPDCEDLTPTEGGVIAAQVVLYLLANSIVIAGATGETPEEGEDPCADLEEICPGLAAPAVTPE